MGAWSLTPSVALAIAFSLGAGASGAQSLEAAFPSPSSSGPPPGFASSPAGSAPALAPPHVTGVANGRFDAAELVRTATTQSQTVRELVGALERSDILVLVCLRSDRRLTTGATQFLRAASRFRVVLVSIDARNTHAWRVAWLAHELAHAVEIAEAPAVRDERSLRDHYRRISCSSHDGETRFETTRAIEAGQRAIAELYAAPVPAQEPERRQH